MKFSQRLLRLTLPILGGAVGLATMVWLFRDLDWSRFLGTDHKWLVLLVGTILLEQLVRAWKWRQILFELKPVSTIRLFGAILAGYGAAILVPLGISPLVRSWLVARLEGLRLASVLVTAAIERFVDGIVFAAIAGFVAFNMDIWPVEESFRVGLAIGASVSFLFFTGLLWFLFRGLGAVGNWRRIGKIYGVGASLAPHRSYPPRQTQARKILL